MSVVDWLSTYLIIGSKCPLSESCRALYTLPMHPTPGSSSLQCLQQLLLTVIASHNVIYVEMGDKDVR